MTSFIFLRETYAPVILQRKVDRMIKETGNQDLYSQLDPRVIKKEYFTRSIIRLLRLLILSPIVLSTSLYVGLIYSYIYLMFTTFPLVFQGTYHFSDGTVGLTYIGLGVGSLIGVAIFAATSDRSLKKHRTDPAKVETMTTASTPTLIKPEMRLYIMIWIAPFIPIGLIIYAWTTEYKVHWIAPIIALAIVGIGNMTVFMYISTYLVDTFSVYAASALAANSFLRSIMAAVLPLAGQKIYANLGLGWGSSLLAFVAFALSPVPIVLNRWGERIRKRWVIKDL